MKNSINLSLILTFLCVVGANVQAAKKIESDHPLLSAYEGSKIYSKDVKNFDEYEVFKGWNKTEQSFNTTTLEGKVTKILYVNPPGRSLLEIYKNYQQALEKDAIEILFECNQAKMECMDGYVGANLRTKFAINGIGNKAGRYMFAKIEQEEYSAYMILGVGEQYSDVHVVEVKKMETNKVKVNLHALTQGLAKSGYVVVDGIYFDTNKTELTAGSSSTIEVIAELLNSQPDLKLYVVGHTDSQGALEYNLRLSGGRAKAVVNLLVEQHGIDKSRLEGHGVASLSPVSSNADEAGRAKNRRVVIVQQ